jgi:hypothetical protein
VNLSVRIEQQFLRCRMARQHLRSPWPSAATLALSSFTLIDPTDATGPSARSMKIIAVLSVEIGVPMADMPSNGIRLTALATTKG